MMMVESVWWKQRNWNNTVAFNKTHSFFLKKRQFCHNVRNVNSKTDRYDEVFSREEFNVNKAARKKAICKSLMQH